MQCKAMVFTVSMMNSLTPIIYAQLTSDSVLGSQAKCEQLIRDWQRNGPQTIIMSDDSVDCVAKELSTTRPDLAKSKNRCAWLGVLYFQLTELY